MDYDSQAAKQPLQFLISMAFNFALSFFYFFTTNGNLTNYTISYDSNLNMYRVGNNILNE